MLSLPYLVVKAQQYFVTSSCMFLDEKTALEMWLDPELNLAIFPRTGPRLSVVPWGVIPCIRHIGMCRPKG